MFARSLFRAAQPLRTQVRRYATEGAAKGTSNLAYIGAGGLVAGGGAYYALSSSGSSNPTATAQKDKAEATLKGAASKVSEAAAGLSAKKAFEGGSQGFISLVLDGVEVVNHNTKKLRFKLPEADQVSGLNVASALLTKYQAPGAEKAVLRPYTPISDEGTQGYIDLLVKKYPDGPMSTHLHDMQPGQSLNFKGPLPKYAWSANKHDHVALIAGGTGITPMYQICRAILNNGDDKTKVTLVFGNVSEADILLKHELEELENKHPRQFRAFYVLDKPADSWPGNKGFINSELLKTVLPEPKSENIKLFVCGPPGMMKAISGDKKSPRDQGELTGLLKELGYAPDQVYKF